MNKILIFGNSGSGKSTLAKQLVSERVLAHLDLDTLAWLPTTPPERAPLLESKQKINQFINGNNNWVIEGCYTDLLELVAAEATEIIFMNLPIELCIENAKTRPWEPHKYESKQAQDNNLAMLINWIQEYDKREGIFSLESHMHFYESFTGSKTMLTRNT